MKIYEKYTAYPALWNASIPSHWNVLPMYAVAREKSICNCVDLPLLSVYLDVGVIPFSDKAEKRTNVTSKDLSKYQRVDYGDFVLNNQQAWRGSVGVSFYTGIVSPAYIVLSMNNLLDSKYANYLLRTHVMVDQYLINSKSVGSIQRNIYWPSLKRVKIPVPPRSEQDQIVKFLDWKVSCINKLINTKKRMIRELGAIKRSVVSSVVTRGLNANIPMKDSTVHWLGNIPEHWHTVKLRQILQPVSLKNHPELPLLSVVREHGVIIRNVKDKETNHNYIPDDLSNYKVVKKCQFVMNKMKAWQGSYGISDFTGLCSPAYFVFDVAFDNLEYFHYAIRSKVYVNFFAQASDGIRVGQWDLQLDKMKEIPFIVPPKEEQTAIVKYIKKMIPKYEIATEKLKKEVAILEECKVRIISDTVTGKIDVCDIEIPKYEFVEEVTDSDVTDSENEEGSEE